MKTARISLAVVSGLLVVFGHAASSGPDRMTGVRIFCGLLLGTVMAVDMVRHPERMTKVKVWFVAVLVLALILHQILTGTLMEAVNAAVWSLAFLGIQIAVVSLPRDPSVASASERKVAVSPEEF